jgi:hypothetical protein
MKHAKAKMTIVSLIPFILFFAAGIMEAIVAIGYKIDPYHWFEHPLTIVVALLAIAGMIASVVCFVCVRIMLKVSGESAPFAEVMSIIGLLLPVVIILVLVIRELIINIKQI